MESRFEFFQHEILALLDKEDLSYGEIGIFLWGWMDGEDFKNFTEDERNHFYNIVETIHNGAMEAKRVKNTAN